LTFAAGVGSDVKHQVQIRVAGALEPLTITCSSAYLAAHLASLISGYCRLVDGDSRPAVWKRTGVKLKLGYVIYRVEQKDDPLANVSQEVATHLTRLRSDTLKMCHGL